MPPPSNRVIARRQRRSNLCQRWHQPQIASLAFAMTLQGPRHRPRTVSLRGGNDEAISSQRWHQPQIASLSFAMTPQGPRHRPRTVSLRGGTTKQSRPAAAPTPDCFTTVRNDTQTPNQIASLAFAMTLQGLPQITSRQCLNISSRPLANSTSRIQTFSWSWLAFASFASTHSGTSPNLKVSWVRTTSRASSRRPS